jgi:SAM-dependent methyltransferase
MNQSERMLHGGGDSWLESNRAKLGDYDPILPMLERIDGLNAETKILEIGCANGWRLQRLKIRYGCKVLGIEPSLKACKEAQAAGLDVRQRIASDLRSIDSASVDIIILGFCMAHIPPEDWLRVVSETDRVLIDRGLLIIHDFLSPRIFGSHLPTADGIIMYFHDWPKLWLVHPAYRTIAEQVESKRQWKGACEAVAMLAKNMAGSVPGTSLRDGEEP